jgi:hypothetical protein
MGQTMETTQTLTGAVDKATNAPMDSFSGYIREGGNTSSDEIAIVTGLNFTLENNLTPMNVVGNQLSVGLSEGRANLTGTLTAYFAGSTLLNKFLNEIESVLEVQMADASANTYTFYMPRIKYNGGDLDVSSEEPVPISLPFQALHDPVSGINTLQISR